MSTKIEEVDFIGGVLFDVVSGPSENKHLAFVHKGNVSFPLARGESGGGALDEPDAAKFWVALVVAELGEVEDPEIVEEGVVRGVDASEHVPEGSGLLRVFHEGVLVAGGRRREQNAALPLALFVAEVDEVEVAETAALLALAAVDDVVGVCVRRVYRSRRPGGSTEASGSGP